jgi:hypothetical protein
MINIIRENDIPDSLNSSVIQEYIVQCVEYKNDPENIDKPEKTASYRNSDLLEAFDRSFHSKCYLTEEKFHTSWQMDIEHFVSQSESPELVYEWTNLFPAEHKANMSKPRSTPVGGYLNPCNPSDDVENQIIYSLTGHGSIPNFNAIDPDNQSEINTVSLLNRLHNGHNSTSIKSTSGLRHAIQKKTRKILEKICDWRAQISNSQREIQLRNELRLLLSKKSSFTMLCRSLPAVIQLNDQNPNIFLD